MNYEKLNKKMSEFFENVTGEELVTQLEELGYKLIEKEQQVNSVDLADVGGSLPDAELAKQLLEVRDQLVRSDVNEAYHILCKAADPDLTTVNHWEKWENIAGQ